MLISETAPLKQNGTLKFVNPCAYVTAVHLWLHALFAGCWKRKLQTLEYEEQLYGLLVWKTKTSVAIKSWDHTRSSFAPFLYKPKGLQLRPAISYFELFKSSSLKRSMDASQFFCMVRHGRNILSQWTVVFQLWSNWWNVDIHSPRDWWWDSATRHSNAKTYNAKSTTSIIALDYLAPTAKYRTIGNLFGVAVAFVCTCIKEVCEAIRNKMASETTPFKTCMLSN